MFWNAEIVNGRYTDYELRRFEDWARLQRAEAVNQLFSATGRALVNATAATGRGVGRGLIGTGRASKALYGRYRRWQQKRATIDELNALSDHILTDIGLQRAEIRSVVEALVDGAPEIQTEARHFARRPVAKARVSEASAEWHKDADQWDQAA